MRKLALFSSIFITALVFVTQVIAVSAASLQFDQASYSVAAGDTIPVQVIVNAGTEQVSGADIIVTYDSTLLQAQSVAAGTFFPSVTNSMTTGKVSVHGYTTDSSSVKTGTGTVATISFKALKSGTGSLQFLCDTANSSNTSKIVRLSSSNIQAENIIVCSLNSSAAVSTTGTVSSLPNTGGSSLNPTPVSTLPQAGIEANMLPLVFLGMILVVAGGAARFL